MSDREAFEAALNRTVEYVEAIGDEILDRDIEKVAQASVRGEEYVLTGHHCEGDDGSVYSVGGHPNLQFFSVLYIFSLERYIGSMISEELQTTILEEVSDEEPQLSDGSELSEDEEIRCNQIAGRELIANLSESDMGALESYLFMFIASADNSTYLHTGDDGNIESFMVVNNIYPYEDEFSIQQFDDTVQSTVSAGRRGSNLIQRTLFVEPDTDTKLGASLDLNFGW